MSERSAGEQPETDDLDEPALRTQLRMLRQENDRLRREYARARRTTYRRTAGLLVAVGAVAFLAGLVLPGVRDVLFVVGAIGVFGGVLTAYLTPERVLTVDVSESVYTALAANGGNIRQELGLQQTSTYVPDGGDVWLFVPQHRDFEVPDAVSGVFVTEPDGSRGVAFTPSALGLVREFEQARTGPEPDSLPEAVEQLGDAAVEQFEIADAVTVDADTSASRVVVSVDGSAFGPLTEFDHPVVSVHSCGAAYVLGEPITVDRVNETTFALETGSTADA